MKIVCNGRTPKLIRGSPRILKFYGSWISLSSTALIRSRIDQWIPILNIQLSSRAFFWTNTIYFMIYEWAINLKNSMFDYEQSWVCLWRFSWVKYSCHFTFSRRQEIHCKTVFFLFKWRILSKLWEVKVFRQNRRYATLTDNDSIKYVRIYQL